MANMNVRFIVKSRWMIYAWVLATKLGLPLRLRDALKRRAYTLAYGEQGGPVR